MDRTSETNVAHGIVLYKNIIIHPRSIESFVNNVTSVACQYIVGVAYVKLYRVQKIGLAN